MVCFGFKTSLADFSKRDAKLQSAKQHAKINAHEIERRTHNSTAQHTLASAMQTILPTSKADYNHECFGRAQTSCILLVMTAFLLLSFIFCNAPYGQLTQFMETIGIYELMVPSTPGFFLASWMPHKASTLNYPLFLAYM